MLFLGVMYHLRYPLLGLDIVARKARRQLVVQCLTMGSTDVYPYTDGLTLDDRAALTRSDRPHVAFIEHRLQDDPTNWWIPNHAAMEAMLRSAGLRIASHPGHEMYLCEPDPAAADRLEWQTPEYRSALGLET